MTNEEMTKRFNLAREAVISWQKGELTDLAALIAISHCLFEQKALSKSEIEFGMSAGYLGQMTYDQQKNE